MMAQSGRDGDDRASAKPGESTEEAERDFLPGVLEALAGEDREALQALLRENTALAEQYRGDDPILGQMRQALAGEARAADDEEFARVVEQTKTYLSACRGADTVAFHPPGATCPAQGHGILTSVTGKLSPEQAMELYRKIAPLLVFEILKVLDRSATLEAVHRLADHLCDEAVQERLRQGKHIRDGIIGELCVVLRDSGIKDVLTKERLVDIMEDCGALEDLNAMENCIRLSQTKAG